MISVKIVILIFFNYFFFNMIEIAWGVGLISGVKTLQGFSEGLFNKRRNGENKSSSSIFRWILSESSGSKEF